MSGKWAIPILYRLLVSGRPLRFKELQRAVAPITQKELTKQLRLFEEKGLVRRDAYMEMPLRVDEATQLGHTMRDALDALAAWMNENGSRLSQPTASNLRQGEAKKSGPGGDDAYRAAPRRPDPLLEKQP